MENETGLTATLPSEMQIMASGEALGALAKAKIDSSIATAKAFPRSLQKFRDQAIFMVTMDTEIAESCFYRLPQDGKVVEGESVRFAEILQSCYQNIETMVTPISNDGRFITVMGECTDLENNISVRLPVVVSIRKKDGSIYSDTMQKTTTMKATAVAFRNSILKVIPKAFIKVIADAAKQKIAGSPADLPTRRVKYFRFFLDNYKISEERLLKALGKASVDLVSLDDLPILAGYMTSLRDNETTVEEIFPLPKQQDDKQNAATNALKGTAAKVSTESKKGKTEPVVGSYKLVAKEDGQVLDMEGQTVNFFASDEFVPSKVAGVFTFGDVNIRESEFGETFEKVQI